MSEKRLVLIDSYAIIYRSYYAFINNPMFSSKGLNTSTIFGFLLTLDDILKKQKPTHIAAAFDTSGTPTFRHEMYPEYKANRQMTPEEIKNSVPVIKQILRLMNIEILEFPGFEADDIIGTIAKKAARNDFEVLMVTPDKDYCQLVEENIKIYKPKKSGNEAEVLGITEVNNNFSVQSPSQVIDILALWGDASDNVPGVPGIGEKTAKKLIADFSSVENLLQNLDKLSPKQKESLTNNQKDLLLSKQLVTIDVDVPMELDEEKLIVKNFQEKELTELFNELNFKSLITRFFKTPQLTVKPKQTGAFTQGNLFEQPVQASLFAPDPDAKNAGNTVHSYQLLNEQSVKDLIKKIEAVGEFCFDTETTGLDPHTDFLVGIAFSIKPFEAFYLPVPDDFEKAKALLQLFNPVFSNPNIQKIGHNLKFDILFITRYGIEINGNLFDTILAHYLLQPEQNHKLDNLAKKYFNYTPIPIEDLIGRKGISQLNMRQVPIEKICEYACEDADVTIQLKNKLKEELEKSGVGNLFYEIESKLLKVLIDIELNGFKLDVEYLKNYSKVLAGEIDNTESEIYKLAGQRFNIASPKQMGEILFEKLQIPYEGKLTKTKQYSTNEEVLQQLTDKHEIIRQILDYRGLTKLQSTYVEALPKLVNPSTGKVHTSFNQSLTVTGRLSSNNPNLQNIPIREERGRDMRKAFVPSAGNILLSADYSQIELRIMAHMSKDANMIDAFLHDADIHTATASKVFKTPVELVTKEQRSKAKTANFGIIYGISAFGLAQRMNIPRKEANDLIYEYFKTFQGVRQYMTDIITYAKDKGYVETLLNRRRYLPDIHSQNAVVRGMAERNAINSPIQGSAADIIKIAMIKIHESFKAKQLQSKMILQVHDELIFDVVQSELELIKEIVKKEMEGAYLLAVPLKVDMGVGNNWLEAH